MTQPLLFPTPPVAAPALVIARRALDEAQREHASMLAEAQENGSEGEMMLTREWKDLDARLTRARENVTALEKEQIQFGTL